MTPRRRVMHVITGLEVGGAETVLCRLLERVDRERFESRVIALKSDGPLGARLRESGVEVEALSLHRRPWRWAGLARRIADWRPDLVQTWLYHADLLGGLAARAAGVPGVIWNVRHANLEPEANERSILLLVRVLAAFSRWMPRRIVYNSTAARHAHAAVGYCDDAVDVIPNGFDVETFRPDPAARRSLRGELSADPEAFLIGLAARFHPQKDHRTFLDAARRIRERLPAARFVLCGRDVSRRNATLTAWIAERGLDECTHLLGERSDMPRIFAALDLAVSSSAGEAFPNAVGEAMACGLTCVVTDAGDSARLVGDAGVVVPRRDPAALADACVAWLGRPPERRRDLGERARRRIVERFSLDDTVRRFEALYERRS